MYWASGLGTWEISCRPFSFGLLLLHLLGHLSFHWFDFQQGYFFWRSCMYAYMNEYQECT
jgi:hypothetical protein